MNMTEMILVEGTILLQNNTLVKNSTLANNSTLADNNTLAMDSDAEVQNLITWRSISQMTDGKYNYNISYADIVFAGLMEGEFCVGPGMYKCSPVSIGGSRKLWQRGSNSNNVFIYLLFKLMKGERIQIRTTKSGTSL